MEYCKSNATSLLHRKLFMETPWTLGGPYADFHKAHGCIRTASETGRLLHLYDGPKEIVDHVESRRLIQLQLKSKLTNYHTPQV